MPTPHNSARKGDIARVVLMPGDPLRAKKVADSYLDNIKQFNEVRNMFGYTGSYKGRQLSVMGSGMGMPSIGIYSYELFKEYDVDVIIRIGSCGAFKKELNLYDVILVDAAYSESSYAKTAFNYAEDTQYPAAALNKQLQASADKLNLPVHVGKILSHDAFYSADEIDTLGMAQQKGLLAVEMESFALFANARHLKKQAACILTVSDSLVNNEETSPEERQNAFTKMMEIALTFCEAHG